MRLLSKPTLPTLASAPGSPATGQMYWDTTANVLYVYNGTAWVAAMGSGWRSTDQGLAGWSFDPANQVGTAAMAAGNAAYTQIKADRSGTVTKLWTSINTAGATLTAGQNFIGLYDAAGNRLQVSADQSTAWTGTGPISATITSQAIVKDTIYYVAMLFNGTTSPQFHRGSSALANAGYTAAPYRFMVLGSGVTALPATFTPSSGVSNPNGAPWVAMG